MIKLSQIKHRPYYVDVKFMTRPCGDSLGAPGEISSSPFLFHESPAGSFFFFFLQFHIYTLFMSHMFISTQRSVKQRSRLPFTHLQCTMFNPFVVIC